MTDQSTAVRPGQIWADDDPRHSRRTLRVERLENRLHGSGSLRAEAQYAVCVVLTDSSGKPTRARRETAIRLSRMRPGSSGYRLVQDAPAGGAE